MKRGLNNLISIEEAIDVIKNNIKPIDKVETIPIEKAAGRVLATDIIANFDVPRSNKSNMDGYALKSEETIDKRRFKIIGTIFAGDVAKVKMRPGCCVEVATGAPIPDETDAVVKFEDTKRVGDEIEIFESIKPFFNVSVRGCDIKKDEIALNKGDILNPNKIGVLAVLGIKEVNVFGLPSIGIISTGNEIKPIGSALNEGDSYDINTYTLCSLISCNNGVSKSYGIVKDRFDDVESTIKKALREDMIIVSAGSSVGERDILVDVIKNMGEIKFHGVSIKPGKPVFFGIVDDKPIFGFAGNPTSCLVNAYILLLPALRSMARLPKKEFITVRAKMSKKIILDDDRAMIYPVKLHNEEAIPVFKGSSMITSISNSDGFVYIPSDLKTIEKGSEVFVYLWQ
jgi:molybdenum cofactor synthesis domain-containing protein